MTFPLIFMPSRFGGIDTFTEVMLHFDGSNGSTTFTDSSSSSHAFSATGNAQISTAQSVFGGASAAFDGSGDRISAASHADFALPGDFTYDFRVRFISVSGSASFVRSDTNGGFALRWNQSTGNLDAVRNGVAVDASFAWSPSINTWYHLAITRASNSMRMFVDGTQVGSTATVSSSYVQGALYIGNDAGNVEPLNGYIDEFRLSKGVARWTANFTPPGQQYTT